MGAICKGTSKPRSDNNRKLMPYKVCLSAHIWSKNSHNLFDFEGNQSIKRCIEVDFSSSIAAVDLQLVALTKYENFQNQHQILKLDCQSSVVKLNVISLKQDHRLWAIIKQSIPSSDFDSLDHWDLQLNDVVKMGRVKLQLLDFKFVPEQSESSQVDDSSQQTKELDEVSSIDDRDGSQCRVCFSRQATIKNPLMSTCKCTGSVKFVHLKCLQNWVGVKMKIKKTDNYTRYVWKRMECEICKSSYKCNYKYQGKTFSIMNVPRPSTSYMMFSITNDEKSKQGMIYVLNVEADKEFKIGRVPECEIKLKDISVSRQHALIKFIPSTHHTPENPHFIMRLIDNQSKFGTLVLATSEALRTFRVHENTSQARLLFQIGRVLIGLSIKPKLKPLPVSVYKHPECLISKSNVYITEMISPKWSDLEHSSSDELNMSDIVVNEPQQSKNSKMIVEFDYEMSVADEHMG